MHYGIRHTTRFTYSSPVRESIMEIRMQPRSELCQRCVRFELATQPRASVTMYRDQLGNIVHHFDIAAELRELTVTMESTVEFVGEFPPVPSFGLDDWAAVDQSVSSADGWEMSQDSAFAARTPMLEEFGESLGIGRSLNPASAVMKLAEAVHGGFLYKRQSTRVDSPIDDALTSRQGVCQDFAHILIALVRRLGVPCRYVSGYLFHGRDERSSEGAMHAWVEVLLPGVGWIGIDPTVNSLAGPEHVRVAVGRDYADIAPTRGVFKGEAAGELAVAVHMSRNNLPPTSSKFSPVLVWTAAAQEITADQAHEQQQQ